MLPAHGHISGASSAPGDAQLHASRQAMYSCQGACRRAKAPCHTIERGRSGAHHGEVVFAHKDAHGWSGFVPGGFVDARLEEGLPTHQRIVLQRNAVPLGYLHDSSCLQALIRGTLQELCYCIETPVVSAPRRVTKEVSFGMVDRLLRLKVTDDACSAGCRRLRGS